MTKYIYLAGPIFGVSYKEANDWREDIKAKFLTGIVGISPMRLKGYLRKETSIGHSSGGLWGHARSIKARDYNDVKTCDMMLAYLPQELNERRMSVGTIMELGWASAHEKLILLVTDDINVVSHPLIERSSAFMTSDLDSAAEIVNGVFGEYVT